MNVRSAERSKPQIRGKDDSLSRRSPEPTTNGKVRVAHVVIGLNPGGLENFVAEMVQYFDGSGVIMSVVNVGGEEGSLASTIRPYVEDFRVLSPIPRFSMLAPVALTRCFREISPDVVHLHSGTWYKGAFAGRLARIPRIVYTEHGLLPDDPRLGRFVRKRAAEWTDVIVAVSDRLRAQLGSEFPNGTSEIRTIANGVDTQVFSPGPKPSKLQRKLRIPGDVPVIGSMGRLEKIKAHDVLLRAFAELRSRLARDSNPRPDPYLVICGEGSQRPVLEALVQELGLEDRVRLPGWVSHPVEYYRLFDLFVLSSVSEGAPLSLLEAMACGVAPIVTAVGANAEILGPGMADQVVAPSSVESLTEGLRRTLIDARECGRIQSVARGRAVRRYDIRRTMDHYRDLYLAGGPVTDSTFEI